MSRTRRSRRLRPQRLRGLGIAALLALSCVGCTKPVVLVLPALFAKDAPPAVKRPESCRYTSVLITYSTEAEGMAAKDVGLSARVAGYMRSEFERLGATVTEEPEDAYWSLLIMGAHDERHYDGFVFSAMLKVRDIFEEGRTPGPTAFSPSDSERQPTIYSGLSYGPLYQLEPMSRAFIRKADAALLPDARHLCDHEAKERKREGDLEDGLPISL